MVEARRNLSTALALGIVIAAIAGYVLGVEANNVVGSGGTPASTGTLRPAFSSRALLEAPSGWREGTTAVQVPGLVLAHETAFASGGQDGEALLTGLLAGGEAGPLPAALLPRLARLPEPEIVALSQTEALRYGGVRLSGFDRDLTLYVLPKPGHDPTVLACYGAAGGQEPPRACEQIALTLRFVGQAGGVDLAPERAYASSVGALLRTLAGERARLRGAMQRSRAPASVGRAARSLAAAFAAADSALAQVEPPLVVGPAQSALSRALTGAHERYEALAVAAGSHVPSDYETARAQVQGAETAVTAALENYALLGYSRN